MIKIKENDHAEAIELLTKAISEEGHVEYYSERAVCYIHTKEFDLSMSDMNKAIELDPDYGYRYSCRAYLKGVMGDARGAVVDYQIAVKLDPDDAIALNNLGLAQENLGYWEQAQKSFDESNKVIGYDPENREVKGDVAQTKENGSAEKEDKEEAAKIPEQEETPSRKKVVKDVFSKRSVFKEFLQFIGNGFKLKKSPSGKDKKTKDDTDEKS